jgi:hypothetical protein
LEENSNKRKRKRSKNPRQKVRKQQPFIENFTPSVETGLWSGMKGV